MIVIIDDSELFRLNVRTAIEEKFDIDVVELDTIRSMREFFSHTPAQKVLLALLDLNLPDGDGLTAMSKIIDKNRGIKIPVIIVSKGVNRSMFPLAKKVGVDDILAKPINPQELIDSITNLYPVQFIPYEKGNKPLGRYSGVVTSELLKAQRGNYHMSLFILEVNVELNQTGDTSWNRRQMPSKNKPNNLKTLLKKSELEIVLPVTDKICLIIMPFVGLKDLAAMKEFFKNILQSENVVLDDSDLIVASAEYPDQGRTAAELIEKLKEDYEKQWADILQERP